MLRSFCSQLLFPTYCVHCVFESGPWIEFFSNCFDPGNQLPPVFFFSQYLNEEASWAFSTAEADKNIPTPTVGFISLCCQIAVITSMWKAQCLSRPSVRVQTVRAPHPALRKSTQGLLLGTGLGQQVIYLLLCGFAINLLSQVEQSDFSPYSVYAIYTPTPALVPCEYHCSGCR